MECLSVCVGREKDRKISQLHKPFSNEVLLDVLLTFLKYTEAFNITGIHVSVCCPPAKYMTPLEKLQLNL